MADADAEAEAQSDLEISVTKALDHVWIQRGIDNVKRSTVENEYETRAVIADSNHERISPENSLANDPEMAKLLRNKRACYEPFEKSIRSREGNIPATCQ
jgi:hypothetical protein